MGLNEDLGDRENIGSAALATQRAREEKEAKRRSCNRHNDCNKFDKEYLKSHPKSKFVPFNQHCHDDECEDCFGC